MTTTDTDALTERIARAFYENRVAAIESDHERRSWPAWDDHEKADADEWRDAAAAVLPIVEAEVRKAKAGALREAASAVDLDKVAEEWSQGPGNQDDMHWAAANAASSVVVTLHDLATEHETGAQR